jgi:hypothetical protein
VKTPYRFVALLATVALAAGGSAAFAHDGGGHHHGNGDGHGKGHRDHHGAAILKSGLVGSTPTSAGGPVLFGVSPGSAPWVVGQGKVKVRSDRVKARVEGLLLAASVGPPNAGTTGPVRQVVASVFCNGSTTASFTSAPVALSADGDARVDERLTSPLTSPCLSPAVLVRIFSGTPGAYIAANGG